MGQQQSSEKPDKSSGSRSGTPADRDKKVNRRQSIQALPVHGRSSPANPSATTASATARTTTPKNVDTPQLEHYLQGSPEAVRIGRSGSRRSKKDDSALTSDTKSLASDPVPIAASPMNVPTSTSRSRQDQDGFDSKAFEKDFGDNDYEERRYIAPAQLRPPRLPLPIADANVPMPESPSLDPIDKGVADVPSMEPEAALTFEPAVRRKSSMVSLGTDDDEVGDELPPIDPSQPSVPTVIEWRQPAHKVYVTGTFANWERKFKMHHKKDGSGHLTAVIHLPPGTHHLMFLADDKMTTNDDMPTAVDFHNVLVNYVEIAPEDVASARRSSQAGGEKRDSGQAARPETLPEEGESGRESGDEEGDEDAEPGPEEVPPGDFRRVMPQALFDMDYPDEDPRYMQASSILQDSQGPPALPMFLSKSILNGVMQVKDDTSVLVLPNHTVLNHLMTSSVKNGVLATSVTTRYKKKYVTTISYKPVPVPKPAPVESNHE